MMDAKTEPRDHEFAEVGEGGDPTEHLELEDLGGVRLFMTADLGQAVMTVRGVLNLKLGSVVALNKLAGEMTDIYINGVALARGEVVVIADALHVRVAEVVGISPDEKERGEDD